MSISSRRGRRKRHLRLVPAAATAARPPAPADPATLSTPGAVDYTLFARRRIGQELDAFVGRNLDADEWDEQVARLGRMGPGVVRVALERIRDSDLPAAAQYAELVCELEGDRAKPALLDILRDRAVADPVKLAILHAMAEAGLDTGAIAVDEILSDPGSALRYSEDMMLRAVEEDERALAAWVTSREDEPSDPDFVLFQAQSLAERNDPRAAAPLHIFARYPSEAVQWVAVDALARIGSGRALTALNEIAARGINRALRRAAQQAAERLMRRGVRPVKRRMAEDAGPIDQTHVTSIDGAGSRLLRVVRKHPSRRPAYTSIVALLNTHAGLKDVVGSHELSGEDVRDLMAQMREDAPRVSRVDPAYAGRLFRDALATTRDVGATPPLAYYYWQDFLPPDWLEPEPYELGFDAPVGATAPPLRDAVWRLSDLPDLHSWLFNEPVVYEAVDRLQGLPVRAERARRASGGRQGRRGPGGRKGSESLAQAVAAGLSTQRVAETDAIIRPLFEQLIPPALPELARRLGLTADLLRVNGHRAAEAAAWRVARDLRALHDRGADAEEAARHPFLIMIMARSLLAAAENMAAGLDPRINPDAFT